MIDVQPTRSQLIELKKKIALSKKGHSLLKMKRDGLIMEFMNTLSKARGLRNELVKAYIKTEKNMQIAEIVEGKISIESIIYSMRSTPTIDLKEKNLMGVKVPEIKILAKPLQFKDRPYGMIGSTIRLDDLAKSSIELLDLVQKAVEIEVTLKKLLDEIEKVKRRVNALEFKVIPELEEAEAYIRLRLEEMERENTFRLKRVKAKIGGK